jgi:hypothetical protein
MVSENSTMWEFIAPSEYTPPPATIAHAVKGGVKGLWRRLKSDSPATVNPVKAVEDLHGLAGDLLECAAGPPGWAAAAAILMAALERSGAPGIGGLGGALLIGPPYGGTAEILSALAQIEGWPILAPPSIEQVLSRDRGWPAPVPDGDAPWVLPELQRCFLRHPDGLALVRQLFHRLQAGDLGPGIIGANSWSWAFLTHVVHARPVVTLAAQAFDHQRLARWFQAMATPGFLFRQSDNRALVMPPPEDLAEATDASVGDSAFLKHLAAYSRGIPGVARELWRSALRASPNEELSAEKEMQATCELGTSVWVLPWDDVRKPALSHGFGSDHALLLHALLIHGGLPAEVVAEVLSFSADAVRRANADLQDTGLIETNEGLWQVSPAGYPAVRSYLDGEGYFTDNF